jgi:hypothetical protein
MTAKLRKMTGIDVSDLDDPSVLLNFNISWWELMDIFDFREKERTVTWNTVAGTILYPVVAPFDALQGLSIEDPDSKQHSVLVPIEESEYEMDFVNTTDARGTPTRYYRENNNVGLWPTPDKVYTIIEKDLTTLADLAVAAPPVPQSWHEIIFLGGVYRCFWDIGDKNSAAYYEKVQANKANIRVPVKAKEEKMDNKWSGLSVPKRFPSDSDTVAGRRIN